MRKYFFSLSLFLLFLSTNDIQAQLFLQAPPYKKKIKQIIEWNRKGLAEKQQKGASSSFDENGNLTLFQTPQGKSSFFYNGQGQLIKIREEGIQRRLTQISYRPKVIIKELSFHGKVYKTESYYKNSILLEEKTYVKGMELGPKFLLKERTLFQYNKSDSLAQEIHYVYAIPKKKKTKKRKTVYRYHPKTKQLLEKTYLDTDGSIRKNSVFRYAQGKLTEQEDYFPFEKRLARINYLYQAGKLWQKIYQDKNKKNVWIYADDRLVRLRSYFGDKIFQIVDYQYVFY
ncbi:MAG: hypothetical protein AB8G15_19775 [Saprospiraceae bacterium]